METEQLIAAVAEAFSLVKKIQERIDTIISINKGKTGILSEKKDLEKISLVGESNYNNIVIKVDTVNDSRYAVIYCEGVDIIVSLAYMRYSEDELLFISAHRSEILLMFSIMEEQMRNNVHYNASKDV